MRGETLIFRQNDESHLNCMIWRPISETAPTYLSSLVYIQRKPRQFSYWHWEVYYFDFNTKFFVIWLRKDEVNEIINDDF